MAKTDAPASVSSAREINSNYAMLVKARELNPTRLQNLENFVQYRAENSEQTIAEVEADAAANFVAFWEAFEVWEAGPQEEADGKDQLNIETIETTETLPVKLTDMDYKEYGIKMGQANQEIAKAEDELAAVKSQFKSRIDAEVAKRNQYASIINSGQEYKKVDCLLIKDYDAGTVTLRRLDTSEVVRVRTMTAEERQRGLKLEAEADHP